MKINRITNLVAMALGLAVFPTMGCAQNDNMAEASSPPEKDMAASTTTAAVPGSTGTVQIASCGQFHLVTKWSQYIQGFYLRHARPVFPPVSIS